MSMLSIKDLQVYYGAINAIKGISFDVEQGEIIALIGAKRRRKDHDTPHHHRTCSGKARFRYVRR